MTDIDSYLQHREHVAQTVMLNLWAKGKPCTIEQARASFDRTTRLTPVPQQ